MQHTRTARDDRIILQTGAITGTLGNDDGIDNPALIGTPDPDTINGLAGNDILDGLAGNDVANGGENAPLATWKKFGPAPGRLLSYFRAAGRSCAALSAESTDDCTT